MSPLEPFQAVAAVASAARAERHRPASLPRRRSPGCLAPVVTGPLAGHFALLALGGWAVALAALCGAGVLWRGQDRRLALVAEAAHELRGPLCAARLGLHALESAGEPVAGRAAAVELELRRAGLALEDLQAAPRGRRTGERLEVLDAGALVTGVATGWSTIARSHGARLRIERAGGPALVRADRLRLAQALGNLVANAAEHGGGEVLVRVASRAAGGCGSRSPTTARACPPRCPSSSPPAVTRTAPAATGWRSRGGSPSATAAVSSPRPRSAARASCSTSRSRARRPRPAAARGAGCGRRRAPSPAADPDAAPRLANRLAAAGSASRRHPRGRSATTPAPRAHR